MRHYHLPGGPYLIERKPFFPPETLCRSQSATEKMKEKIMEGIKEEPQRVLRISHDKSSAMPLSQVAVIPRYEGSTTGSTSFDSWQHRFLLRRNDVLIGITVTGMPVFIRYSPGIVIPRYEKSFRGTRNLLQGHHTFEQWNNSKLF